MLERLGLTTRKFDASRDWVAESCWIDPGSTSGEPGVGDPPERPYGKWRLVVVGASESSASIRSTKASLPREVPSWPRSFARNSELRVSAPPPFPKIEPMNAVTAMASLMVHGGSTRAEGGGHAVRVGLQVVQRSDGPWSPYTSRIFCCSAVTSASVCALGTKERPLVTSEKASMPGTSATAARAGPRPSWSSSERSCPVT